MKKIKQILFIALLVSNTFFVFGQQIANLEGINYQAVAIDDEGKEIVGMDIYGKPLYEKTIGVRFTILSGADGPVYYQETHTVNTDKYGLFSLVIGQGDLTSEGQYDILLDIPWINGDQFLKVEIAIHNDGAYKMVSNQKFMAVPYSFYTDDIADDAVTTNKILNETILAEDIGTGSVETSEILDETILAEDIATGAVETSEILNETILAEDIGTGSVATSEVLNETILAEDIATGAVETSEIKDGTIQNEDIADGTIDLTNKVTDVLPVQNGGTGNGFLTDGNILVGSGTNPAKAKILVSTDSSILITQTADSIILSATFTPTEVLSDPAGTFVINNLPVGSTYTSNAINAFAVDFGNIIIGSIDTDLKGCMLTAYVSQPNVIRISVYNGTGGAVNLGTVNVRVFVVN